MSIELKQTKGKFTASGIVNGTNSENFYREGYTNAENHYKAVRFGIKTHRNNTAYVEIFGAEQDWVYPYSFTEKKSIKIPFEERFAPPEGYKIIGVNLKLGDKKEAYHDYDAIDVVKQKIQEGMPVFVSGEMRWEKYTNQEGNQITNYKLGLKYIGTAGDMDFDDDKFKERCHFEQEIIVTDVIYNKETKKMIVNAYIILWNGKIIPGKFAIDVTTHEDMARTFKKFGFGDHIKVHGRIINRAEMVEGSSADSNAFGETNDMKLITKRTKELLILGGEVLKKKKYKEEDFVQAEEQEEEKPKSKNDDDDEDIFGDINDAKDEDIPF